MTLAARAGTVTRQCWATIRRADHLRRRLLLWHRSTDFSRRAQTFMATYQAFREDLGPADESTHSLLYTAAGIEVEDEYFGETGGAIDPREQKHWRDLLAGKGGDFLAFRREHGQAALVLVPVSAAPVIRRLRVACEVQGMRCFSSGLNRRGYAVAAVLDAPSALDRLGPRRRRTRLPMRLRGRPRSGPVRPELFLRRPCSPRIRAVQPPRCRTSKP